MRKRIRKAWRKLGAGHPVAALRALMRPHHSETRIETARAEIADRLREMHGNCVAHGPFAGQRLPGKGSWGRHDISAKILGTYERQVVDLLADWAAPDGVLVDIGSADGYFAIGALRAGWFARCICFERSEKGRRILVAMAKENEVADRITILGEASPVAVLDAVPDGLKGAVLCDIEGAEFDILDADVLKRFRSMPLVVELHDFLRPAGSEGKTQLTSRAAQWFSVDIIRSADPPVWQFPELDQFDDDYRMLAFSEGRDVATEWMVLTPKADTP